MITAKGTYYGDSIFKQLRSIGWAGVQRVTVAFWVEIQRILNVPNPKPYNTPSAAGEPPRKRTGYGAANVSYELDKESQTGRVGVQDNAKYMAFLELGTTRTAQRPWLMVTLLRMLPTLATLAQGKKK